MIADVMSDAAVTRAARASRQITLYHLRFAHRLLFTLYVRGHTVTADYSPITV